MSPKVKLRVLGELAGDPTVAAMQKKLGGPFVSSGPFAPGDVVRFEGTNDARIVLFSDAEHGHVWAGRGEVRRTPIEKLVRTDESDPERIALAARVRHFASLEEGTEVAFTEPDGGSGRGTLLSHCLLGGLVRRDDGAVVAVGFLRFT